MTNEGYLYDGLDDRDVAQRTQEFKANIREGRVHPRTDRGIRLGMTIAQVQAKLGSAKRTLWSKRFAARELIYTRFATYSKRKQRDVAATGMSWHNYYLFRKGRLYYVEFCQDLEGGA